MKFVIVFYCIAFFTNIRHCGSYRHLKQVYFNNQLATKGIWLQKFALSAQQDNQLSISKATKSILAHAILSVVLMNPAISSAKSELPSLEKCFHAIEKELDPINGESLIRLKNDIKKGDWDDMKLFTREYDAGFRGGVLKNAWRQFDGEIQKRGIELSNSFTFDLIALNKAARIKDVDEATRRLEDVRMDLQQFLELKSKI